MSGIQNSQIPVFRVYFTIEIRRKNSGPRVASGGDRIPVLSDSGILKLYCICIICTRVYFWACERNCIYVKVNLHMRKYTPPCKYTPARTRCIFAFAYMYFIHICIFGHVNAQQIYTCMQCFPLISSGSKNKIF